MMDLYEIKELQNIYKNGRNKYVYNPFVFSYIGYPEEAYWLGFLMADGCIQGNTLCLCLGAKDKWHLEKFRYFMTSNHPIYGHIDKKNNKQGHEIHITSKELINQLANYGIIAKKRGKEQIKNIPEEYYSDFILGYFDGDGCVSRKKPKQGHGAFSIASSSECLLKQIREILVKECDLNEVKIHRILFENPNWKDNTKIITWTGKQQLRKIYDYIYSDWGTGDFLERKKDKFENILFG